MKVCEPLEDTIAAIATPIGAGGIGIIKMSGPEAWAIGRHLFHLSGSPQTIESHHLYHGHIVEPETHKTVDEVLISFMRGPSTYTREDVVEINCHSGLAVLDRILELVIRAGARLAEPGEFTRRAFLNGRIDLTQAEAEVWALTPAPGRGKRQIREEAALSEAIARILARHGVKDILRITYQRQETRTTRYVGPGRGGPHRPTRTEVAVRYQITSVVRDEAALTARVHRLGWRVYATTNAQEEAGL